MLTKSSDSWIARKPWVGTVFYTLIDLDGVRVLLQSIEFSAKHANIGTVVWATVYPLLQQLGTQSSSNSSHLPTYCTAMNNKVAGSLQQTQGWQVAIDLIVKLMHFLCCIIGAGKHLGTCVDTQAMEEECGGILERWSSMLNVFYLADHQYLDEVTKDGNNGHELQLFSLTTILLHAII